MIRQAVAAGSFYPEMPERLRAQAADLIAGDLPKVRAIGAIVPTPAISTPGRSPVPCTADLCFPMSS